MDATGVEILEISANGLLFGEVFLDLDGTGTLTLDRGNSYTGGTIVDGGILRQSGNNRILGSLTINEGAKFESDAQQTLYTG